ncbi:MAG TPA: T9SS type A sorting domain-containing protein [Flavobacteriales bacterium]|nr:T9SS type A sorting domain-containing protein [Flavobacteriales bacterium]
MDILKMNHKLLKIAVGFILFMTISFGFQLSKAQCPAGQSEVFIDVITDDYGYDCYWELLLAGDTCGGNSIIQGGNMAVGCYGGCAQAQTSGGYADNTTITEGPWCLQEGNYYDIVYVDDYGDGGITFEVNVSGQLAKTISGSGCGGTYSFMIQPPLSLDSSNLPIVVLNTLGQTILDDPKITIDMGIIYNGPGQMNHMSDPFNDYDSKIGIEYRGSSSQSFPKKSYGLETRDVFGNSLNVPILGMPSENDWILYAPYSDKSLIRNVMAFELGAKLGGYAPRTRLCELVLDNSYQGVYVFMEKIKRASTRVDISGLGTTDTLGDQVTGGYIIKIDKSTGGSDGWVSPYPPDSSGVHDIFFQYDYPDWKYILPVQQSYIQDFMYDFESTLKSPWFLDVDSGYKNYVDITSFADFLIMNELTNNVDGYRLSTFMNKDKDSKGGKLTMGPLWDFNLAFGNADYCNGGNTFGWAYDFNSVCPGDNKQIPFWWERILQDSIFVNLVKCRWDNLRNGEFHTDTIMAYIDSLANYLDIAQQRNFNTWNILGTYIWPNNFIGNTYQEEIDYMKTWASERLVWLDSNISGICYPSLSVFNQDESTLGFILYPNPADKQAHIINPSAFERPVEIMIFDQFGKLVYKDGSYKIDDEIFIESSSLSSGIYICKIRFGNKTASRKFIIIH